MKNFKILVCEDDKDHQRDVKFYLDELNQKFENLKFEIVLKDFNEIFDELKKCYDLFILDFYDGEEEKGETVLSYNSLKIKTLIYSSRGEKGKIDYNNLETKYPFLIGYKSKGKTGDNLKNFIQSYLFENNIIQSNYVLYNENDIFLQANVNIIGTNNLNEIIYSIKSNQSINGDITIYKVSQGYSGAAVFKLKFNDGTYILKLSKDVEKLKTELENSRNLYNEFPSRFLNPIKPSELNTSDNKIFGILMKEVDNSETFFNFLCDKSRSEDEIKEYLNILFINSYGLKDHYEKNKQKTFKDWQFIFIRIDKLKYSLIENSINELKPLLKNLDLKDLKNLVINGNYNKIDKDSLLDDKYKKELTLCHGDLHAKNILVQGNQPVIIDTGGINYNYWCMDVCRLIVNLFISGFDIETKEFYDINKIEENVTIASEFIQFKAIPTDNKNDNFINAINWLIENVSNIYGNSFSKWEFQLGLMKEFLQVSYRVETVPPNKRAISLLCAYNCMIQANENVN